MSDNDFFEIDILGGEDEYRSAGTMIIRSRICSVSGFTGPMIRIASDDVNRSLSLLGHSARSPLQQNFSDDIVGHEDIHATEYNRFGCGAADTFCSTVRCEPLPAGDGGNNEPEEK